MKQEVGKPLLIDALNMYLKVYKIPSTDQVIEQLFPLKHCVGDWPLESEFPSTTMFL